jgi:uncharacterized membrane protein
MSDWYYAVNNEQKGPISESELKAQFAAQKLPSETLVWKDGMDNWTAASQVPALIVREPAVPTKFAKLTPTPASVAKTPGVNNPDSTTPVTLSSVIGAGEALEVDPEDAESHKIFGIISYLIFFWWVPLVGAKNSPFAKYHANQGLVLFVLWIVVIVVIKIIDGLLGMLGLYSLEWIFGLLFVPIIYLLVVGIINAAAGKCVPLPVIGKYKLL